MSSRHQHASEANDLDRHSVFRAQELPMHLSRFLEPAAVRRGHTLEACNSIDGVPDRIYWCIAGADGEFFAILADGRLRPACVRQFG
jgi:hypothetical protein